MSKVLIFGGNRFVGKALSQVLLDKDYSVDVFNRSGTSADNKISIIQGDRNNIDDINKIDFHKYDCIVDMCLFFPRQFEMMYHYIPKETNYIFVSSGAADYRYIDEYGEYGKDKLRVEELLELSNLNYDVIRPSYIVGRGDHRARLDYYINKIESEQPIKLDGDGTNEINMVFVQDVVKVLEKLVDKEENEAKVLNVCGNDSFDIVDFVNKINKKYYNKSVSFLYNQDNAILPKNTFVFDSTQTCINLDITFTNFYDGFDEYVYNL